MTDYAATNLCDVMHVEAGDDAGLSDRQIKTEQMQKVKDVEARVLRACRTSLKPLNQGVEYLACEHV